MEKDILADVIETEREIQKCLELEAQKAGEWLEQVRRKTALEHERAEREYRAACERTREDAEREAVARATIARKESEREADRLRRLDDRFLKDVVEKRIRRILPG